MIFGAVAIANLLILPKLLPRSRRRTAGLLAVTILSSVCFVAVLALSPTSIYFAACIYAVIFLVVGIMVSSPTIGWPQSLARLGTGTVVIFGSVGIAHLVAYAPR